MTALEDNVEDLTKNLDDIDLVQAKPGGIDPHTQGSLTIENDKGEAVLSPYKSDVKSFKELNVLRQELLDGCAKLGYNIPSRIQAIAIPQILDPKYPNFIGQAHHGSGKTGAFCLAMLQRVQEDIPRIQCLCLCHTRELSIQTYEVCNKLGKFISGLTVFLAIPGKIVPNVWESQIVIGTPGFIYHQIFNPTGDRKPQDVRDFKVLVIDEADELLKYHQSNKDKGNRGGRGRGGRGRGGGNRNGDPDQNLTDQTLFIIRKLDENSQKPFQRLLFSATYPDHVKKFALTVAPSPIIVKLSRKDIKLENVKQYKIMCKSRDESSKIEFLKLSLGLFNVGQSIIFVNSVNKAKELVKLLTEKFKVKCSVLFGKNMDKEQRDKTMDEFRNGNTTVLVATNLIARGIDVPTVRLVINYEIPLQNSSESDNNTTTNNNNNNNNYNNNYNNNDNYNNYNTRNNLVWDGETFMHRVGRTGRYGINGVCLHLVDNDETNRLLQEIENRYALEIPSINSDDIDQLQEAVQWIGQN